MTDRGHAEVTPDALADEAIVESWRGLAELRSNPFLTPEWSRTALVAYPDEEPATVVWRRDGEVRGVLPLVVRWRGLLELLRFPAARRADWVTPACRPEDEVAMGHAVAAFFAERWGSRQALRLDRLDAGCAWPGPLLGGELAALAGRDDVLPFVAFGDDGFEGYLAGRSRNFRSQLGRRRRKLEREHDLAFRASADPGSLEADLDLFFALHDERFASRGEASSQDEAARRHLRLFAAAALERGWLRLWIAEADGAPAAAWYGWRIGERYCYALAGLKQEFEKLALGTVLLAHTIEQAAAEGAAIYDLMWGDEGYKERFETGRREARTWTLTRRRGAARLVIGAGGRSRRALTSLPPELKRPLARVAGAVRQR
ncbi:MAG TPA: GNAT family N-acetyltransferase [Solirubrobacterales bacterium]|nr:GNAT family N-acetyltransferase [Solirubrobacterales bacterium]